jgi:hypothetical protein
VVCHTYPNLRSGCCLGRPRARRGRLGRRVEAAGIEPAKGSPRADGSGTLGCRHVANRGAAEGLKRIRFISTAGLLNNRDVGVVGVEEVRDVPPRPVKYLAEVVRRHHRVVHPWADNVAKTHSYPDLTR